MIITTGIFTLLVLALFAVMRYGVRSWKNIEARNSVQTQLRKVELFLLEDLKRASYSQIRLINMPVGWTAGDASTLTGVEKHGTAVWFLSALCDGNEDGAGNKHAEGEHFLRDSDGKPDWQRNVLYYATKPSDAFHQQKHGFLCADASPGEADTKCPHKWLLRKEIAETTLISDINPYVTTPAGYDLSVMQTEGGNKVKRVQLLADSLLVFKVVLKKPEILVDLKAFRVLEAGDILRIGESSLDTNVFTVQYDARVVPNN